MALSTVAPKDWLRRYHSSPDAGAQLICFPHAGGSANYFSGLSRLMAPSIEVLSVQYPGRQDRFREQSLGSIAGLADSVCDALLADEELLADASRPVALFGHSMGATVAFEVARRLRREGMAPSYLFASGRRPPSGRLAELVHLRDDPGVVAELRRLGGTAFSLLDDPEFLALALPIVRSDLKAIETYSYVPGRPLDCPIMVLIGDSDPYTNADQAFAWHAYSTGEFALRVFSGGHFYLDACQSDVASVIFSALSGTPAWRPRRHL